MNDRVARVACCEENLEVRAERQCLVSELPAVYVWQHDIGKEQVYVWPPLQQLKAKVAVRSLQNAISEIAQNAG